MSNNYSPSRLAVFDALWKDMPQREQEKFLSRYSLVINDLESGADTVPSTPPIVEQKANNNKDNAELSRQSSDGQRARKKRSHSEIKSENQENNEVTEQTKKDVTYDETLVSRITNVINTKDRWMSSGVPLESLTKKYEKMHTEDRLKCDDALKDWLRTIPNFNLHRRTHGTWMLELKNTFHRSSKKAKREIKKEEISSPSSKHRSCEKNKKSSKKDKKEKASSDKSPKKEEKSKTPPSSDKKSSKKKKHLEAEATSILKSLVETFGVDRLPTLISSLKSATRNIIEELSAKQKDAAIWIAKQKDAWTTIKTAWIQTGIISIHGFEIEWDPQLISDLIPTSATENEPATEQSSSSSVQNDKVTSPKGHISTSDTVNELSNSTATSINDDKFIRTSDVGNEPHNDKDTDSESTTSKNHNDDADHDFRSYGNINLIDSNTLLANIHTVDPIFAPDYIPTMKEKIHASIHCESDAANEQWPILCIRTSSSCYVFDSSNLIMESLCTAFHYIFGNPRIVKLVHDLYKIMPVFRALNMPALRGALDAQLLMEHTTGDRLASIHEMLTHFHIPDAFHCSSNVSITREGPYLPHSTFLTLVRRMSLLWKARESIIKAAGSAFDGLQRASDKRSAQPNRCVAFNMENWSMGSSELLQEFHPVLQPATLVIGSNHWSELIGKFPLDIQKKIVDMELDHNHVSEIVLDVGRRPFCWVDGKRVFIDPDGIVTPPQIEYVIKQFKDGGLHKTLHRIKCIRNRVGDAIGLSIRLGRHVYGTASMISDLLYGHNGNILVVGVRGTGKTTIVREVAKTLEEKENVFIIDPINEIAGDCDIAHPSVGHSRRMIVPSPCMFPKLMIECAYNFLPSVMVTNEICHRSEVEALRLCKHRGVRLIAAAVGNFESLVKNTDLKGLIGGCNDMNPNDVSSPDSEKQKGTDPIFDIVIELLPGDYNQWNIILNTQQAVDDLLRGRQYKVHKRTRDPITGDFDAVLCKSNE